MTSWHDDRTGVYLIDSLDFLFKCWKGFSGDNDLDADLRPIALELPQTIKECKIPMSLIDADMEIVDVLAVLLHRSLVKKMTIGGKEQVEWFLMCVLQDFPKILSYKRISSLKTQDDDA
jgi:hypothetical protein